MAKDIIIVLVLIIIILISVYVFFIVPSTSAKIKESLSTPPHKESLLVRTTNGGNELLNKTVNIKDGGIYYKLLNNVQYEEIVLETNATHNLFIYLGHVGGDEGTKANYIRNPVFQNATGKIVALDSDHEEVDANTDFGNVGYELALNEYLPILERHFIRGTADGSAPVAKVTRYRSTLLDNAMQKHVSAVPFKGPKNTGKMMYIGTHPGEDNKFNNLLLDSIHRERKFTKDKLKARKDYDTFMLFNIGKSMYSNYDQETMEVTSSVYFSVAESMSKFITDNLSNVHNIMDNEVSMNTINRFGYIPLNFNYDATLMAPTISNCVSVCAKNNCVELEVEYNITSDMKTFDLKESILKMITYIKNNKIGYENGLKLDKIGCATYGRDVSYHEVISRLIQSMSSGATAEEENESILGYSDVEKIVDITATVGQLYVRRSIKYTVFVPASGTASNHYNGMALVDMSNKIHYAVSVWKMLENLKLQTSVRIINRDLVDRGIRDGWISKVDIDIRSVVKNIIKIKFDKINRVITVYKCDSWKDGVCVNPVIMLTHGLMGDSKSESELIYYPEVWIAFKRDMRIVKNASKVHGDIDMSAPENYFPYRSHDNRYIAANIPVNTGGDGIDVKLMYIKYNSDHNVDAINLPTNYKYYAGKCRYSNSDDIKVDRLTLGITSDEKLKQKCISDCDVIERCIGFTIMETKTTGALRNGIYEWTPVTECLLHLEGAENSDLGTIINDITIDGNNFISTKKYLKNVRNNACYKQTSKKFKKEDPNIKRLRDFKIAKYTPVANYLNIMNNTKDDDYPPSWMKCAVNANNTITCQDTETAAKFVVLYNVIITGIQKCYSTGVCDSPILKKIEPRTTFNTYDALMSITNFDGHDIQYLETPKTATVYFITTELTACVVRFDGFTDTRVYKGATISLFKRSISANQIASFVIVEFFSYVSHCKCTMNAVRLEDATEEARRIILSITAQVLNEKNISCQTPSVITKSWDRPARTTLGQRFVALYSKVNFRGVKLTITGGSTVHIIIGNVLKNDSSLVKNGYCVMPISSSGIQISLDVILEKGIGSYVLRKKQDKKTYDMLSNFVSRSNEKDVSNVKYTGGENDYYPVLPKRTLNELECNSLLGSHKFDGLYTYDSKNGVATYPQSFLIDFDEHNSKLYILYKSSLYDKYALLMDIDVVFDDALQVLNGLYVVSEVGIDKSFTTTWQAGIYRYSEHKNLDVRCYDNVKYIQDPPFVDALPEPKIENVIDYIGLGPGRCKTTSDKIPPYKSYTPRYNPLTDTDIDLTRDNDNARKDVYEACAAYCSPPPSGVNAENDCIGFDINKYNDGYLCRIYANVSADNFVDSRRRLFYTDGLRTKKEDLCVDVCDNITKTYNECEKYSGGCSDFEHLKINVSDRCYARAKANILTKKELNDMKEKESRDQEEQMRIAILLRESKNIKKPEPPPPLPHCAINEYELTKKKCACPPSHPIAYSPMYDKDGVAIDNNTRFKCGAEKDLPPKCGIRELSPANNKTVSPHVITSPVSDASCECPNGRIKVVDEKKYWCDLRKDRTALKWSECLPDITDPKKGSQFKSAEVKFRGQGSGTACKSESKGHMVNIEERACTPVNLSLDYWIRAFRDAKRGEGKGCTSPWFTLKDDYKWGVYKNGIEYYIDSKNKNFSYQHILNWAESRYNEGDGVCNVNWRGPAGKCVASWEKTDVKDIYSLCNTDTGRCTLKPLNKKQTEMDPKTIDLAFVDNKECTQKCPLISQAYNDSYTLSIPQDAPKTWSHGKCNGIWEGGKRDLYWLCEPDRGAGSYGVRPVLLTDSRAKAMLGTDKGLYIEKDKAIARCTPLPPEYEGPEIDNVDHTSFVNVLKNSLDNTNSVRFPKDFANENNIKKWHDNNPLLPHPELYGNKVSWYKEFARYKSNDYAHTDGINNTKCTVNPSDINVYAAPRKHMSDFTKAGYGECIALEGTFATLDMLHNQIYTDAKAAVGNVFYVEENKTAYTVVYGRSGEVIPKKWNIAYNYNNKHWTWPNDEYSINNNYSLKIQPAFKIDCKPIRDLTKLHFLLKWRGKNNDPTLSYYGYAKSGNQLVSDVNDASTFDSLYACAQACRDRSECKYFTYYPGKGMSYFKGSGSASIYPSNSYPLTYHGSSYGGVAHEAASKFYDPYSIYNQPNYVGNKNLYGFFRLGKIHLSMEAAEKMGCTWVTGVDDRRSSIDNDTHLWPITLMSDLNIHEKCTTQGCYGDIRIKKDSIPGMTQDIIFPHWFFENKSFNFLEDPDVNFPVIEALLYKTLTTSLNKWPQEVDRLRALINDQKPVNVRSREFLEKVVAEYTTKRLDALNRPAKHKGNEEFFKVLEYEANINVERARSENDASTRYLAELESQLLTVTTKLKEGKEALPILSKTITSSNKALFESIPVHNLSPFQRYSSTNERDDRGPTLRYLIPPMVSESIGNKTVRNIAVYRHSEINTANVNLLSISCDHMMRDGEVSIFATNKKCKQEKCDTSDVMEGTTNYRGSAKENIITWTSISRTESSGEVNKRTGRCELYNFNVDDPVLSSETHRSTISGVLTDRSKYTGKNVRSSELYNTTPHWAADNPNVTITEVGNRVMVKSNNE